MQAMGNSKAKAVYEANLPNNYRRSQNDSAMEQFIRGKYEAQKWIDKTWTKPEIVIDERLKINNSSNDPSTNRKVNSNNIKLNIGNNAGQNKVTSKENEKVKKIEPKKDTNNAPPLLDFFSDDKPTITTTTTTTANNDFFSNSNNINNNTTTNTEQIGFSNGIDEDLFSNFNTSNSNTQINGATTVKPQIPTQHDTNQNDLNDLLITSDAVNNNKSKQFDKNSILALYGGANSNNNNAFPFQQQQQQQLQHNQMNIKSGNNNNNGLFQFNQFQMPQQQHPQKNMSNDLFDLNGAFQTTSNINNNQVSQLSFFFSSIKWNNNVFF
jgi:stromal membrane-associated protein